MHKVNRLIRSRAAPILPVLLACSPSANAHGQGGLVFVGVSLLSLLLFLLVLAFLWGGRWRALAALAVIAVFAVWAPSASFELLFAAASALLLVLVVLLVWWGGWKRAMLALLAYLAGVGALLALGFVFEWPPTLFHQSLGIGEAAGYVLMGVVVSAGGWLLAGVALLRRQAGQGSI